MNDADQLSLLQQGLIDSAGGFLRNILHEPGVTCEMCAKPVVGGLLCLRCSGYAARGDVADAVGFMVYGVDGMQSGKLMYGYKSAAPGPSHMQTISSLVVLGIREHRRCADALVGVTATHWATVPSLRRPGWPHPFRAILTRAIKTGSEIELAAGLSVRDPREVTASNFEVRTAVPAGAHVMVIDDTWTTGGHAQSVAAALKGAGAQRVSVLTMARWLDLTEDLSKRFYDKHIRERRYDPSICPWTGGDCPGSSWAGVND